jgi:hypothetical protein
MDAGTIQGTYPHGTAVPVPGRSRDVGAVCLAVLKRDGFISLDSGDTLGSVVTRRFTLPAGRLFVNVDARAGELRAGVETEDCKIVTRSKVVSDDATRQPLAWEAGDLASLAGRRVAVRYSQHPAMFVLGRRIVLHGSDQAGRENQSRRAVSPTMAAFASAPRPSSRVKIARCWA